MKNSIDNYRGLFPLFALALLLAAPRGIQAKPPDLTMVGAITALKTDPNSSPVYGETYNLGATGLRGWIYIGGGNGADGTITTESRQIQVKSVASGSPAAGLLAADSQVLPGVEAYAVNIAKNHSLFGTTGHMYARKNADGSNNGPLGNGYGCINSAGMHTCLGLLLAKRCGLTNPEIDAGIQRRTRYYAYHAGKGGVPYGDFPSYREVHETNGKNGLAAVCFRLASGRAEEAKYSPA